MKAYHITPLENVGSILKIGLEPRIGKRSKEFGEIKKSIYFFTTLEDVETALAQWLGKEFEDTDRLALLEVDVENPNTQLVEWEISSDKHIDPNNIRIISLDM